MLSDIQSALDAIGLAQNTTKTFFITSGHFADAVLLTLPGENCDAAGFTVLGRTFLVGGGPQMRSTLRRRRLRCGGDVKGIVGILKHLTSEKNKLLVIESCLLQTVLWQCCTWSPAKPFVRKRVRNIMHCCVFAFPLLQHLKREGTRHHISHTRHVIGAIRRNSRPAADVLMLRRFHSWAGHIARAGHSLVASGFGIKRSGMVDWPTKQPSGLRHDGKIGACLSLGELLSRFLWGVLAAEGRRRRLAKVMERERP